ncbi:MAG: hypothetical protein HQ559_01135 [Lentisphaerae bacterium]|nr:hypothetical protein [Lentisphaerota bacterium]
MTNDVTSAIMQTAPGPAAGFFAEHAGEIVVGVVTAALLGAGALIWQLFIHPRIQSWQKRRAIAAKREEVIASLNGMTFSIGSRIGLEGRFYISVTLPNTTSRPLVIREVAFRPLGGARLILWHKEDDKLDAPITRETRTGIEIPPQSEATWYYDSPNMRGDPMIAEHCSVRFEYVADSGEMFTDEMYSPAEK